MTQLYDLIAIGTGSAASSVISRCAEAGWKIAVIDEREFGGTCALRGCDPKKVLAGAAQLIDWNERMKGKGVEGNASIHWPELMAFKRTFTESIPRASENKFKQAGMDTFHGKASFIDEDHIRVGDEVLQGKHILIATGARPATLSIDGAEHLIYSDDFLDLEQLPDKLVLVGGGYIAFEFAHIAARAGTEVHIIHRGERPLEQFDSELVDLLLQKSEEVGIQVHLNAEVKAIRQEGSTYVVSGTRNGAEHQWQCGLVVHGAGRIPNVEGLELEKGNVSYTKKGISVNEYLQSESNPKVYAAGDVAATEGLPLTPLASQESRAVSLNLLEGNHNKPNYKVMPSIVFTVPSLGSVGLDVVQAKKEGYEVKVNDMSKWYTYKRTNEKFAMAKVVTDKATGRILGAHVLGGKTEELINLFAMAIQFDLTTDQLNTMNFAYPTAASDLGSLI
ncbi:NAD(P)/FAD-dependent oxidoreductase [Paenibacillus sp. JNUCC31]|uniref:dihydrolipoyl dehydrogenase family protein n=1 Tax=Paenibacillus sp. JNUCC-31 TaxID=2777983 RepID=UPI00177AEB96|nr:NAD(P)/FAD-dependent oxidoreductase [Paenibacillus sp. JNUCC-31]QOS78714.1 NAD(P)/FAD-dependent oxidoreductase [Paenibacillus sp. JNUCC-31]